MKSEQILRDLTKTNEENITENHIQAENSYSKKKKKKNLHDVRVVNSHHFFSFFFFLFRTVVSLSG